MKIALIGYGKMGKTIEQIAISRGHEIVSRIDIDNQEDFNSEEFKSADVAIEFTAPKCSHLASALLPHFFTLTANYDGDISLLHLS